MIYSTEAGQVEVARCARLPEGGDAGQVAHARRARLPEGRLSRI